MTTIASRIVCRPRRILLRTLPLSSTISLVCRPTVLDEADFATLPWAVFERNGSDRCKVQPIAWACFVGCPGPYRGMIMSAAMKAVLLYHSTPDVLEKAPLHFAAHKARVDAFQ